MLGVVVVLFIWNRIPVEIVAIGTAVALWATGLLTTGQAMSGFGDPVTLFIASVLVVGEALDASGATSWAAQRLTGRVGDHPRRLLVLTMVMGAALTPLITLNGAVAALMPIVMAMALRSGQSPSQLLMPLTFAGGAGGLLILTGSPVNVIISEVANDAGAGQFGFFEFTLVGVPALLGVMAIIMLLGGRLLPKRAAKLDSRDSSKHAEALIRQYALTGNLYRLRVREWSPLVGIPIDQAGLADYPSLTVVGVQGQNGEPRVGDTELAANDVLVVQGDTETVSRLLVEKVLAATSRLTNSGDELVTHEIGVAEVVVPPRSQLIGNTVFPGMRRHSGLVVLAVQRFGEDRGPRETELQVGDTLLVEGTWEALDQNVRHPDLLVVDSPDMLRRQVSGLGRQGKLAIAILAAMVVLLAFGLVPPVVAGLLAAGAMIMLRVVRLEQIYRAMPWTIVILIGGLIPLSTAIKQSGAADEMARVLVDLVGEDSPYLLLIAIFVLVAILGAVVSNVATALIVAPIAVSAATGAGVSVQTVLMAVAVGAAASFLTAISTHPRQHDGDGPRWLPVW